MSKRTNILSPQEILSTFKIDNQAGQTFWLTDHGYRIKSGDRAGCFDETTGYRVIGFNYKHYLEHVLIFISAHGSIPAGHEIDHINGIRDDNRIGNLRAVTQSENQRNRSMQMNNSSGFPGVSWHIRCKRWQAQIMLSGKQKYLGVFKTAEAAYLAFAREGIKQGFDRRHITGNQQHLEALLQAIGL